MELTFEIFFSRAFFGIFLNPAVSNPANTAAVNPATAHTTTASTAAAHGAGANTGAALAKLPAPVRVCIHSQKSVRYGVATIRRLFEI